MRIELHLHTTWSHDGQVKYSGLVKRCRRLGLAAVAVTDHDTIDGALRFQEWTKTGIRELQIMVGEERTLENGRHVIGLFLKRAIQARVLEEVAAEIHEQGGLCILPHPFRLRDGVLADPSVRTERVLPLIDAIEVFNPKCSWTENEHARKAIVERGIPAVGGSDAHYEADAGEALLEVDMDQDAEQAVRDAVAQKISHRIIGVPQHDGGKGRSYAASYYRRRGSFRMPTALVPLARKAYRLYRNTMHGSQLPKHEIKFEYEQANR
ncbi:MAG: hypothetical protein A3G41_03410 [Elusimicrobia bacterium RIFCSPLOWO2_12_FULL_59_9]|nr:MAG: hypothetical protein A3G41_03410 [Elusimicrobia bacterium RIFCSPLOWO2_12_FULL_59_9]